MCGITGIFNYKTNHPVSRDILKKMCNTITHRGPDDEGFYIDNSIGLGFRRLSIIDLTTGNQPIHNENKTVWVTFNGEIYNYVELKNGLIAKGHIFYTTSDTEVIVHLYEEYGKSFVQHLNGMYSIAIWDDKEKILILARDRAGIKPLYYAESDNGVIFASEIKAILSTGINRQLDHESISQYLSYGYIPSPLTGFKAIRKLGAGCMLVCSENNISEEEFWDLPDNLPSYSNMGEDDLADLLIDKLQSVLLRQTRSDVPLGIFLSGGIDSSLLASVAAERCNLRLSAFTIGFKEESYNELDNAEIVTKRLGLPLNKFIISEKDIIKEIEQIISFIDEPLFDYSAIPVYFVSKFARKKVKTVIGGEGGDELFGGYPTHYLHRITEPYRKIPGFFRKGIKSIVNSFPESHNYLSTVYKLKRFTYGADYKYDEAHYRWKVLFDANKKIELLSPDFLEEISRLESFYPMETHFIRARDKKLNIQDQLMYVDFKTFLQDDPLQKTDRMSMANSLEIRVPLLDNEIIDFSCKVPLNYKINRFRTKYLLRKALSRFQPAEIAFGRKRGFTPPMALWIKNGMRDYMISSLSKDSVSDIGFLNYKYITKIIDDHLKGRAENSRLIWSLIVLVNWYRNYIK